MGRRRNKNKVISDLSITDFAAEGKALGRTDEKVVFVRQGVPGDVADVRVVKSRRKFFEAEITAIKKPSPLRKEPFCSHFGICGGCKWQNLDYDKQLEFKYQQVEDQLTRIGKLDLPEINPIMGSAKVQFYRNKLEFTFSNQRWLTQEQIDSGDEFDRDGLGFHIPGRFDKIVHVDTCYLQQDPSNAIRNGLYDFAKKEGLSFFDLREQKGLLRNLFIRTASSGDLMVMPVFFENDTEAITKVMEYLHTTFDSITSLQYILNEKKNDSIHDLEPILYKGLPYIRQQMEDLTFHVGPKSFYQTNDQQAFELYKATRAMAKLTGDEIVYDLYTGTGTIANFVAKNAKKVIGIEYIEEAVADARVNSEINEVKNTVFYAGDMKDVFTEELIQKEGKPDVVIVDPPRAGMHEDVVKALRKAAPKRIVYVSCNPATQARDTQMLEDLYKVEAVQPVDMFPQTHHVENILTLELK